MATRQYIGARYVPKFFENPNGSCEWAGSTIGYESLTIVTHLGNSFTSKKTVPAGIDISDTRYWVNTGNFNSQVEQLADEIDSVSGQVGQLTSDVSNISNNLSALTNLVNQYSHIITVGASGAMFTTINAAITYARTICNETNRVLLVLQAGLYEECVNLHPNPGIDMIGYGAKIRNTSEAYPETALYTNHTGTFVGIYFENLVSGNVDNYAVHVERDLPNEHTGGIIKFIDCEFVSHGYSGIGIGMSPAAEMYLINCRCYTGSSETSSAALYLHSASIAGAVGQTFHAWNCQFKGTHHDFRIDDALTFWGNSGESKLYLDFVNCTGNSNTGIFCLTQNVWNNSYNHDDTNIILENTCRNNSFLALNKETETGALISASKPVTPYNQIFIESPLGKPTAQWRLVEFKLSNNGVDFETHANADVTNAFDYGFVVGSGYAGTNVQTAIQVRPA